jgi:hypothetical protein
MKTEDTYTKQEVNNERNEILNRLEGWLETPMKVLGFIWLALLVVELRWGLTPFLEVVGTVIWAIFILDFVVRGGNSAAQILLHEEQLAYSHRAHRSRISNSPHSARAACAANGACGAGFKVVARSHFG